MTPAEREVRQLAVKLRGAHADMAPFDRLVVMRRLLDAAETTQRFSGAPDPHALIRLAAHCTVWAEQSVREPAA